MLKSGKSCLNTSKQQHDEATYSEQYAVATFSRALLQRDIHAWQEVQQIYRATVLGWLRSHPTKEAVNSSGNEEDFVALTFEHLWLTSATHQAPHFSTQAAVLRYLQANLNAVLVDTLRTSLQLPELPATIHSLAKSYVEEIITHSSSASRETPQALLPHLREQRLAYLLYHCGLKPEEIVHYCPQEFSNVQEISRLRRHILAQLLRNCSTVSQ
ncbi:MAG: hypothetical protein NVSMB33_13880 [Ktedonobacteraceae bacterium]